MIYYRIIATSVHYIMFVRTLSCIYLILFQLASTEKVTGVNVPKLDTTYLNIVSLGGINDNIIDTL